MAMTALLRRENYDTGHTEIRRILLTLALLAGLGGLWHAIRPAVIDRAARSAIGSPDRDWLVAVALNERYPAFSVDDYVCLDYQWSMLFSHTLPRPGWVAWLSDPVVETNGSGVSRVVSATFNYADDQLRSMGSISWLDLTGAPPGDIDGDGRWEVVLEDIATRENDARYVQRWAVVRLGETSNEIVWLGLTDHSLWSTRGARIKPIWRDEDANGINELVFVTVVYVRPPGGRGGFQPPNTVAVFEWDTPGGTLAPRLLPENCGVLPWTPPDGAPVRIRQDEALGPVLEALHPLPESFGVAAASAPVASVVTSSPTR